jgi:hypothetical protein
MNSFKPSILYTVGVVYLALFACQAMATEEYNSYCLESAKNLSFVSLPIEVNETFSGWKLSFDGDSIYRESDVKVLGAQIGTPKQEIWSLNKFRQSGNGKTGAAPVLQVKNAHKYFLSKILFEIGSVVPTEENARALDSALASCEGVSDEVALDGQIPSKSKQWMNGGELARRLREKIRLAQPQQFQGNTLTPLNAVR